ncbi:hypothetical protein [Lapillicoccus jejuensis]|uniref:Uncharacterized protein n=1 Tax=Lapillicoccus jejuensis TaxID=402171 RepID=A0A542E2L7_9MICO|nr:hypothetical protein [Lapillicoccus jejuensis]TQJ09571.1 hypothetical protein FB458_2683 [Lapillicoccus jejuensis]
MRPGDRPGAGRAVSGRALEALAGVALVASAVGIALAGAPSPVRTLFSLPVVVLVAGRALGALVLGARPAPERRAVVDEGTLRVVVPVLLGVVAALGSALLLGLVLTPALGVRVTTTSLLVAAGAVAAALHLVATAGRRTGGGRHDRRRTALVARRVVLPALGAVLLLVGAVAGARALLTERVERYTQLALTDPPISSPDGLVVAPGARVTVGWVLRAYDEPLPTDPPVTLTVAGAAAGEVTRGEAAPPADATGATASRAGTVSATAPTTPGLYRVALTVGDAGAAQTLDLVLEVRP